MYKCTFVGLYIYTKTYYYKNIALGTVHCLRHKVYLIYAYTIFWKLLPSSHKSNIIKRMLLVPLCRVNLYPRAELPSANARPPSAGKIWQNFVCTREKLNSMQKMKKE
jgi:hypothetical protein